VSGLIEAGRMVAPFSKSMIGSRSYFVIRSANTRQRPHVRAFVDWLIEEAKAALAADGKEAAGVPNSKFAPRSRQPDLPTSGSKGH
jgi:hypothetical protein